MINKSSRAMILAGSTLLGYSFLKLSIYKVEPGERAIIFNRFGGGIQNIVVGEGFRVRIPFVEEIIKYDIKIQPYDHLCDTGTKDLQKVTLKIRLFYKPVEKMLPKIHLDLNIDYMNKVLPALGNEVSKAVVARYDAEQLLKNREKVASEIKEELTSRAKNFYINLEDVSIFDLRFSREFMDSIEKKQVAQQEAEKYKYIVMQKEQEKLANIIQSEGNSIAAEMISNAVQKHGMALIALRKIQASQEIVETLQKSKNVGFIPFNSNMLLNLNQQIISQKQFSINQIYLKKIYNVFSA